MLDWFAVHRQLVNKAEVWVLSNSMSVLLLLVLLRAAWMYIKFKSWPLSDMQMLLPSLLIGMLLLVNWTLKGNLGSFIGSLLGLGCFVLGWFMLPFVSWPLMDLPQWIVYAAVGFMAFSFIFTSLARMSSRLRLRLHGREWIIKHARGESFARRLDAHRHLNGLSPL